MKVYMDEAFFTAKEGVVLGMPSKHAGVLRLNSLQPKEISNEDGDP